jgi:hypothetical protein
MRSRKDRTIHSALFFKTSVGPDTGPGSFNRFTGEAEAIDAVGYPRSPQSPWPKPVTAVHLAELWNRDRQETSLSGKPPVSTF